MTLCVNILRALLCASLLSCTLLLALCRACVGVEESVPKRRGAMIRPVVRAADMAPDLSFGVVGHHELQRRGTSWVTEEPAGRRAKAPCPRVIS